MHYVEENDMEGLLLLVDFDKAFDSVKFGNKKYSNQILCADRSHSNVKLRWDFFSFCMPTMIDINFKQKIQEISKLLKIWQHPKLTFLGKNNVINPITLPNIIHLLKSLPSLYTAMLDELNRIFFSFIWDGKTEKIKRKTPTGSSSKVD